MDHMWMSSNINEVIRAVLNFFFLRKDFVRTKNTKKQLRAQKAQNAHKEPKASKNTKKHKNATKQKHKTEISEQK